MAPEILENWKVQVPNNTTVTGSAYEFSADVYSTTVVVWECLTAQQPYVDARDPATGRKLVGVFLGDAIVAGLRPIAVVQFPMDAVRWCLGACKHCWSVAGTRSVKHGTKQDT